MKKLTLLTCLVLYITGSVYAITPGDGKSCRKYEEALYLNTALNNAGGVTQYLDSLRGCGNDSPETLLSLGRYLYNQNDYKGSDETLLYLISDPNSSAEQLGEAWYYYGMNAYYRKMYSEAMKRLLKSVKYGYKLHWCYNSIGLALSDSGAYKQSIEFYDLSLKSMPGYTSAINNKGLAYDNMGINDLALKYYIMADSLAMGRDALYRSNITRQYRDMENYDLALASARIGIKNFPNDWRTVYDMSNVLNKKKLYNDALKYACKLQTMHPSTADDWLEIGYLYDGAGRPDSAMLFYRMSLRLDPNSENTNHNMGIIYRTMGMFDKAEEHIGRALQADPDDELVINSKIQLCLWQHQYGEAYKWCQLYDKLYPDGKHNYLNSGYILLQLKRYPEAIHWLKLKLTQVHRNTAPALIPT